jgi:hypothetical protein
VEWLPGVAFSGFVGAEMQRLAGIVVAAGLGHG